MSVQLPESSKIVKQYKYQYSLMNSLLLLLLLGAYAISNLLSWADEPVLDKVMVAFALVVIFFALQITLASTYGNLKLFLTEEGLYLPNVLLWGKYRYLPFANVVRARAINMMGNEMLELRDGSKNFVVTNSWLPEKGAYQEIVEYVLARVPESARTG
ncbi:MAG: hypothetical protein EPO32_12205 [Anaerolineae bacterium]|nr:MAG: hypothetical protein EPO32_12205 [Anaerolineae bacterium]